jgi:hypothetical protein
MSGGGWRAAVRRERLPGGGQRVTSVELFFNLVYVLAVTQLSPLLLAAAATLVVAAVAVSDTWMARGRARSPAGETPSVG